jgi:hypothetical protein
MCSKANSDNEATPGIEIQKNRTRGTITRKTKTHTLRRKVALTVRKMKKHKESRRKEYPTKADWTGDALRNQ